MKPIISEYSVNEGSTNPIAGLLKDYSLDSAGEQFDVLKVNMFEYGVLLKDGRIITNGGTDCYPQNVVTTSWDYLMIHRLDAVTDYVESNLHHLIDFYAVSQNDCTSGAGRYACAVTALYECAQYYGLIDYSDPWDAYLELWTRTGSYYLPNNTIFGATPSSNIGSGFINYASYCGNNSLFSVSSTSASYSFWTNMIDDDCMGVLAAGIYIMTENGVGQSEHAVAVEGYSSLTNSINQTIHTLLIADGWDYEARNLVYYSDGYYYQHGYAFYE